MELDCSHSKDHRRSHPRIHDHESTPRNKRNSSKDSSRDHAHNHSKVLCENFDTIDPRLSKDRYGIMLPTYY